MPLPWFVQQRAQYYRQQAYARFVRGLASFVLVRIGWASSIAAEGVRTLRLVQRVAHEI